jgi:spoIIIJ-associated protein
MKKIKMKGKEVAEALAGAAKVLGKMTDQLEYKVLNEGRPGVLGVFGGEEAEIEAWEKIPPAQEAQDVLQEIINKIGLMAISEIKKDAGDEVEINIKGEELGQAIGKEGATLMALQTIVSSMVSNAYGRKIRVYIDAGGYRERHEQALARLASEAAKDVIESGKEKALPPMSAADRRIIHMSLAENDKVQTYSEGEGAERRLIIAPK